MSLRPIGPLVGLKETTRSFSDVNVLKILYNSFVLPSLTFGSVVWSPFENKDIDRIESVQHKFIRYLAYSRTDYAFNSSVKRLLRVWNQLPANIRNLETVSISSFKMNAKRHLIKFS